MMLALLLVVLRVEHRCAGSCALAKAGATGSSDRSTLVRAISDRLALFRSVRTSSTTAIYLRLLSLVDEVGLVGADHRPLVGSHHAQLVDLVQLGGLRLGGARHAGQLCVKPK